MAAAACTGLPMSRMSLSACTVVCATPPRVRSPKKSTVPACTTRLALPARVFSTGEAPSVERWKTPATANSGARDWPSDTDAPCSTTWVLPLLLAPPALPVMSSNGASSRMPRAKSSVLSPRNSMRSSDNRRILSKPPSASRLLATGASTKPASGAATVRPALTTMRRRSGRCAVAASGATSSSAKLPPAEVAEGRWPSRLPCSATPPWLLMVTAPAGASTLRRVVAEPWPSPARSSTRCVPLTSTREPASSATPVLRASSVTVPPPMTLPCTQPRSLGSGKNVPAVEISALGVSRSTGAPETGAFSVSTTSPPGATMRPARLNPSEAVSETRAFGSARMAAPRPMVMTPWPVTGLVDTSATFTAARVAAGKVVRRVMSASAPPVGSHLASCGSTNRFCCCARTTVPGVTSMPSGASSRTPAKPRLLNSEGARRVVLDGSVPLAPSASTTMRVAVMPSCPPVAMP